jgi:hypothetical protein
MLRSRLFWAKFWLVATGVWWGVCMQLLFYEGAGHPLAMLPNLDWYIGMMLVYGGRLCTPRSAYTHYATIRQRHVLPIAVCDFLGTVGTTMGRVWLRLDPSAAGRWLAWRLHGMSPSRVHRASRAQSSSPARPSLASSTRR